MSEHAVLTRATPPRAPVRPSGLVRGLAIAATAATFLLLAIGSLVRATGGVFAPPSGPAERANRLARMAGVATALAFVLLAVGTYVRGEGASLAFPDWPLMNGRVVPHLGALRPALQFSHRALAAGVFAAVVVLVAGAWSERRSFAAV